VETEETSLLGNGRLTRFRGNEYTNATTEELSEALFSKRSVRRLCKESQLELSVRRVPSRKRLLICDSERFPVVGGLCSESMARNGGREEL
jgi:hypothetical protein